MKARFALVVPLLAALQACGSVCGLGISGDVTLTAAEDAANGSALAVDLVVATDDTLAAQLATLTALQYFAARPQMQRDNPEAMQVSSWEIVPGQTIGPNSVDFPCGTSAIFVYASYPGSNPNRAQLTDLDDTSIVLNQMGFEVVQ